MAVDDNGEIGYGGNDGGSVESGENETCNVLGGRRPVFKTEVGSWDDAPVGRM